MKNCMRGYKVKRITASAAVAFIVAMGVSLNLNAQPTVTYKVTSNLKAAKTRSPVFRKFELPTGEPIIEKDLNWLESLLTDWCDSDFFETAEVEEHASLLNPELHGDYMATKIPINHPKAPEYRFIHYVEDWVHGVFVDTVGEYLIFTLEDYDGYRRSWVIEVPEEGYGLFLIYSKNLGHGIEIDVSGVEAPEMAGDEGRIDTVSLFALVGTDFNDVIRGRDGNDQIYCLDGNRDIYHEGEGADSVQMCEMRLP